VPVKFSRMSVTRDSDLNEMSLVGTYKQFYC